MAQHSTARSARSFLNQDLSRLEDILQADVLTISGPIRQIDAQLISDFYRLVEASQGVIRSARGANYNLSHPFDSKVVPTDLDPDLDPSQIEKRPSKLKQT